MKPKLQVLILRSVALATRLEGWGLGQRDPLTCGAAGLTRCGCGLCSRPSPNKCAKASRGTAAEHGAAQRAQGEREDGVTIRQLVSCALAALALAILAGPTGARAEEKVVVYTANDDTLNNLAFEAFSKETGIKVEPVSAGSGVVFKRIQAEKDRPQGDVVWGVSRSLLQTNKAYFAPYKSVEPRCHTARVPRPRQSLDRQQRASRGDPREQQGAGRGRGAEELGGPPCTQVEGQDRLHRPGQLRLGLHDRDPARGYLGRRRGGLEQGEAALRQSQGAQPLLARLRRGRQRRVSARHLARVRGLSLGPQRRADQGDLSLGRHRADDGGLSP